MSSKIYVGIDESGSSVYEDMDNIFVICAVIFESEVYSRFADNVAEFLNVERIKEIKYSKFTTQRSLKIEQILQNYKHEVVYIIEKVVPGTNIEELYNISILDLISKVNSVFKIESINLQIDEMYGERKQQKIKKKISQRLSKGKINKVQFVDSHKSIIVQIADYYAGKRRSVELKSKNM